MALLTVFNSNLDPATENLSVRFTNATGFYIDAPLLGAELEIDVFLQVYIPNALGERVRNIPLGKIEEQAILLNVTDTQSMVAIPQEFVDTGLEMALLFLASSTTFLSVTVVLKNCNLCSLDNRFDLLDNRLNDIESTLAQILNAVLVPDPPVVLPTATQLLFFFLQ